MNLQEMIDEFDRCANLPLTDPPKGVQVSRMHFAEWRDSLQHVLELQYYDSVSKRLRVVAVQTGRASFNEWLNELGKVCFVSMVEMGKDGSVEIVLGRR